MPVLPHGGGYSYISQHTEGSYSFIRHILTEFLLCTRHYVYNGDREFSFPCSSVWPHDKTLANKCRQQECKHFLSNLIRKLLALHPLSLFLQAGSDPVGQVSLMTTNDKN